MRFPNFGEGISRADVEHAVNVVERSMARLPPPAGFEEGRVTRSRTRAGTSALVPPLEHDRPRRTPVSSIQRAKSWWSGVVAADVATVLYSNDWACVVNTIPQELQSPVN